MKVRFLSLLVLPLVIGAAVAITASETNAQERSLFAILRGSEEVPGPGDPDGIGAARVHLDVEGGQICVSFAVARIQTATAAHIHEAPAGKAGPVVVDLTSLLVPGTSIAQGCVEADADLIAEIAENPSDYYVNVHNPQYPAGAVRGELQ